MRGFFTTGATIIQTMRSRPLSRRWTPLVLAWFMATLLAAMVAPALAQGELTVVCHGGAVTLVPQDRGDEAPAAIQALHCPACALAIAPPPGVVVLLVSTQRQGPVAIPLARSFTLVPELPWRARGPPSMV
jgi:hypothetical protein